MVENKLFFGTILFSCFCGSCTFAGNDAAQGFFSCAFKIKLLNFLHLFFAYPSFHISFAGENFVDVVLSVYLLEFFHALNGIKRSNISSDTLYQNVAVLFVYSLGDELNGGLNLVSIRKIGGGSCCFNCFYSC